MAIPSYPPEDDDGHRLCPYCGIILNDASAEKELRLFSSHLRFEHGIVAGEGPAPPLSDTITGWAFVGGMAAILIITIYAKYG